MIYIMILRYGKVLVSERSLCLSASGTQKLIAELERESHEHIHTLKLLNKRERKLALILHSK